MGGMPALVSATMRKPPSRYHHGDLRRALLEEAVGTIARDGVERLTLRDVGARLGVSRTALYRHFANKSALLAAVARDGFDWFRQDLLDGWSNGEGTRRGFELMGVAYVRFAVANPSHYRVSSATIGSCARRTRSCRRRRAPRSACSPTRLSR